jgi:hypothetical protein
VVIAEANRQRWTCRSPWFGDVLVSATYLVLGVAGWEGDAG